MRNKQTEIKVGLALGGGGSRGSYQVGILRALYEEKLLKQVEQIAGTSIGAVNTLMVMSNFDYNKMIETWEKISDSEIYGHGMDRLKSDGNGLYSIEALSVILGNELSMDKIRNSRIEGHAVVAKIKNESLLGQIQFTRYEKKVINLHETEDPRKAVLASASIPVLFGSTVIDGEAYIDGGVVDNCPVEPLIQAGCNVIFAVPIHLRFNPNKFKNENILLISMKTHYLFHELSLDSATFKPEEVKPKAEYGYMMGKFIIKKIRELGFLDENNNWNKPDEFKLYTILKKEEKELIKHQKETENNESWNYKSNSKY